MGDKPATRKGIMALDLSRLSLVRGVQTCADFGIQAATVRHPLVVPIDRC